LSPEPLSDSGQRPDSPSAGLGEAIKARIRKGSGGISPAAAAVALYVFMLVSRVPELVPFGAVFRPMVILAALAVALAFTLPQSRTYALFRTIEARAVVGIFGLIALSVPLSYWPSASVGALLSFAKVLVYFFLLIYCIRTRSELRLVLWAFLAAIVTLEIMALFGGVDRDGRLRVTSTYDPNDIAFVMACALPTAAMLFFAERGALRRLLPPIVFVAMLTVIFTKSRGGFISLVVVGLIVLCKLPSGRVPFLRTGAAIAAIVAFTALAPASYWQRIVTIWDTEGIKDGYLRGGLETARWSTWRRGIQLAIQHPVTGVGAGAYGPADALIGGHYMGAHSSFIQIAAELGLGGLALFVFLLYRGIINGRAVAAASRRTRALVWHYWTAHAIEGSVWGFAVAGATLTQGYSEFMYFFVAMSVVLRRLTAARLQRTPATTHRAPSSPDGTPWWKRRG
jgi:O-antigen ligase